MFPALQKFCDIALSCTVRNERVRLVSTCCSPSAIIKRGLTSELDSPRHSDEGQMQRKTFVLAGDVADCKETRPVHMLIDSGASDSFASLDFVVRHQLPMRKSKQRSMVCAASQRVPILGAVDLVLLFEGRGLSATFLVVKNLVRDAPLLLGDDILRSTKAVLDYGTRALSMTLDDDAPYESKGMDVKPIDFKKLGPP